MEGFFVFLFGILSTGLFGVWAGRCWQRAIDAEKTLDALSLKWEMANTVEEEFEEVEQLLMDYAERLEKPTASALNDIINESTSTERRVTEPNALRGVTEPVRDRTVSEGGSAADPHRHHREQVERVREEAQDASSPTEKDPV